jgi:DNA repair photolyase
MFSGKRSLQVKCDAYIDLYNTCNINCKHCKFQKERTSNLKILNIDYSKYENKKVLFCYSVDPYPYGYESSFIVRESLEKLHKQNCSVVFLTRRASELTKDLDYFDTNDYIGISLSENCDKNSIEEDIIKLYTEAKKRNIKTWLSLEPVYTADYVNDIVKKYGHLIDFIRVGKDDLINYDWESVKINIKESNKVYVK